MRNVGNSSVIAKTVLRVGPNRCGSPVLRTSVGAGRSLAVGIDPTVVWVEASIPPQAGSSRVFLASSRLKEIRSASYRNGHVAWHPAVSCQEPPGWAVIHSTQVTPAKLGVPTQLELSKKQ